MIWNIQKKGTVCLKRRGSEDVGSIYSSFLGSLQFPPFLGYRAAYIDIRQE